MAFDTSIFRQERVQPLSPVNALMQGLQLQGAQQGNALQQAQMQYYQQEKALALQKAQQEAAARLTQKNALLNMPSPQAEAVATLGGDRRPTPQNAARIPQVDPRIQAMHPLAQAGLIPFADYIKARYPENKVKDYKAIRQPDGTVTYAGLTEDGRVIQTGQQPFEKPEVRSFGDYNGGIDPITGKVTNYGTIGQSADNKASVDASLENAGALRDQAQAVRDAARIATRASDETALRKEFADLPEVKKFKNAIPAYQAIVKAAKTNNPQADINLIYGLAKLYDPDSVVREGEYDTIANSQSIPEWLKGQAQRLSGGGKLTAETKRQILEQAGIRIKAYENEVNGAKTSYEQIAKGRGLEGSNVFPSIGEQLAPSQTDAAAIIKQADAILLGGK